MSARWLPAAVISAALTSGLPAALEAQSSPLPQCVSGTLAEYLALPGSCQIGVYAFDFTGVIARSGSVSQAEPLAWQAFRLDPVNVFHVDGSRTYGFRIDFGADGLAATSAEALQRPLACVGLPGLMCSLMRDRLRLELQIRPAPADYYTPPRIEGWYLGGVDDEVVATSPNWYNTWTEMRVGSLFRVSSFSSGSRQTTCSDDGGSVDCADALFPLGFDTAFEFLAQAGLDRSTSTAGSARAGIRSITLLYDAPPVVAPEPSTVVLVAGGLLGIAGVGLRRRGARPSPTREGRG